MVNMLYTCIFCSVHVFSFEKIRVKEIANLFKIYYYVDLQIGKKKTFKF